VRLILNAGQPKSKHRTLAYNPAGTHLDVTLFRCPTPKGLLLLTDGEPVTIGLLARGAASWTGEVARLNSRDPKWRRMVASAPKSLARRDRQVQAGVMDGVRRCRIGKRAPGRKVVRQPDISIELRRIEVLVEYQAKSVSVFRRRYIIACKIAPWFR
jgi:hypothetical protein